MAPIRTAAELPLLILAPNEAAVTRATATSLAQSLPSDFKRRLPFSVEFTRAASAITVHAEQGGTAWPAEPILSNVPVTVRVTYLFHCGVPLVGALMCRSLSRLLGGGVPAVATRPLSAESPERLRTLVAPTAVFAVLEAEATLPNQGAAYETGDAE